MKPVGHKESSLKTTKKGNVTINPKKEDLMSENLRSRILSNVESLKEAAKKKDKHIKAAKAGKRWQDSDGDGKWYEPGQDVAVKKEEACAPAKADNVADDAAKKAAKERMKQKMMQATIDFDRKRAGGK
jgi:hypothetical protein|tara:strand:+ start:99 stop:485 length:387 start_codon:yes stop_codon:yes gene_type:complete